MVEDDPEYFFYYADRLLAFISFSFDGGYRQIQLYFFRLAASPGTIKSILYMCIIGNWGRRNLCVQILFYLTVKKAEWLGRLKIWILDGYMIVFYGACGRQELETCSFIVMPSLYYSRLVFLVFATSTSLTIHATTWSVGKNNESKVIDSHRRVPFSVPTQPRGGYCNE